MSACGQKEPEAPPQQEETPTPCTERALIAEVSDQVATLARDETLKTYTLTYSPKTDSTLTALVCDTTAYDLSALVGQVQFSGKLRAAEVRSPSAVPTISVDYYSMELQCAPNRHEGKPSLPQDHPILGVWEWVETGDVDNKIYTPREGYYIQFRNDFRLTHSDRFNQPPCCSRKATLTFSLSEITKDGKTRQTVTTQYHNYAYDIKEGYMYLYRYYHHNRVWYTSIYDKFKSISVKNLPPPINFSQVKNYPRAILGRWVNAGRDYKENLSMYARRPPGRFIWSFFLNKDNSCKYTHLNYVDAPFDTYGTWEYFKNPARIEMYSNSCKLKWEYQIIKLTENILKVRVIRKPFKQ